MKSATMLLLSVWMFLVSWERTLLVSATDLENAENTLGAMTVELAGDGKAGIGGNAVDKALEIIKSQMNNPNIDCTEAANSKYYSITGLCNNLLYPAWGAAFTPFVRVLPSAYSDGKSRPRIYGNDGSLLPSARLVSTECLPSVKKDKKRELAIHNQMLMQFCQFFAHDLTSTPMFAGTDCCDPDKLNENGIHEDTYNGGPCFPIPIPKKDRFFHNCMAFNRSSFLVDDKGVAQQINMVTSFIDHSTVYGSTKEHAALLRSHQGGKMRLDEFGMLPQDNLHKCLLHAPLHGCPVAGDDRVNVFPGLTSSHLLFVLEHNRLADKLAARHPDWSDERLYQEARRINIAELQNLVYYEYLPLILGKMFPLFRFNQSVRYDPNTNPGIINSFAAASYRYGHSQISTHFRFGNGKKPLPLDSLFFRPHMYCENRMPSFGHMLESLLTNAGQKFDHRFARGVTDFLFFGVDAPGQSSDLPAKNIQRGRDHGLPPYNDYLDLALTFIGHKHYIRKIRLPSCIPNVYRSVDDVDLFLGGVFEMPVPGGVVGPVFAYLNGKQFQTLREGDRYFFDLEDSAAKFTKEQVANIKQTSFAGIICRNGGLDKIQRKIFLLPHKKRNPEVPCADLPDVDFSLY